MRLSSEPRDEREKGLDADSVKLLSETRKKFRNDGSIYNRWRQNGQEKRTITASNFCRGPITSRSPRNDGSIGRKWPHTGSG